MPNSATTIQNQITGCERDIKESLAQCAIIAEDKDFEFTFSLGAFVNSITTTNLNDTSNSITKVMELFQECEKIMGIEKKRRQYTGELQKLLTTRQRKETVERLTRDHSFKKKSILYKIPTPPNSQGVAIEEEEDMN